MLATDGRYLLEAAGDAPDVEVVEGRQAGPTLVARAAATGAATIAVEATHVTLAGMRVLRAAAADEVGLVETSGLVERLRAVKDGDEIDALRRACEITDAAFDAVVLKLSPGVTEREVVDRLYAAMRAAGAEGAAFGAIVAFGANSAVPHHAPTDRELARGDLVKTDFGARYAGYNADLTRTVVLGRPAEWQREIHAEVGRVQRDGRAAARPGAMPAELDADACREIEAAGYQPRHGLGHGVGLQIHEEPFLTPGSPSGRLEAGMTFTVEPGIYIEGRGGVRIEDTLVLTDAEAQSLTASTRELVEI